MHPSQILLVAPSTSASVSLSIAKDPDTAMSRFVEVAPNPEWPASVRRTLMRQPDDYFRPHFQGRVPTAEERAACIETGVRCLTPVRVFENNLYRVEVYATPASGDSFVHLGITRHDGGTCKEWRHLQRIKNEIVGPEYEAMEMFPAESRLVDTGNQYHLWVHKDPAFRFPVGWTMRLISDRPLGIEPSPGWQPGGNPDARWKPVWDVPAKCGRDACLKGAGRSFAPLPEMWRSPPQDLSLDRVMETTHSTGVRIPPAATTRPKIEDHTP